MAGLPEVDMPLTRQDEGLRESFWLQGMMGGIKREYDCILEFSEVDYSTDLKRINKPTLVIQGDDDQIVLLKASGEKTAKIVKGAQLKVYPDGSRRLAQTEADKFNTDVLAFIANQSQASDKPAPIAPDWSAR